MFSNQRENLQNLIENLLFQNMLSNQLTENIEEHLSDIEIFNAKNDKDLSEVMLVKGLKILENVDEYSDIQDNIDSFKRSFDVDGYKLFDYFKVIGLDEDFKSVCDSLTYKMREMYGLRDINSSENIRPAKALSNLTECCVNTGKDEILGSLSSELDETFENIKSFLRFTISKKLSNLKRNVDKELIKDVEDKIHAYCAEITSYVDALQHITHDIRNCKEDGSITLDKANFVIVTKKIVKVYVKLMLIVCLLKFYLSSFDNIDSSRLASTENKPDTTNIRPVSSFFNTDGLLGFALSACNGSCSYPNASSGRNKQSFLMSDFVRLLNDLKISSCEDSEILSDFFKGLDPIMQDAIGYIFGLSTAGNIYGAPIGTIGTNNKLLGFGQIVQSFIDITKSFNKFLRAVKDNPLETCYSISALDKIKGQINEFMTASSSLSSSFKVYYSL